MKNRPTICFVTRKWPPAVGGIETYSVQLSQALEVHADIRRIVLVGNKDGSAPHAIAIVLFGIVTAFRLLFSVRPAEITHVADMASWPLALAAKIRSPKAVIALSAHGTDVSYPLRGGIKGKVYGRYLRVGAWVLRRAVTIANSKATAVTAASYGFRNIHVVSLATDMETRPYLAPKFDILFSGRLIVLKGCSWFIREVLHKLPEQFSLTVAGTIWDQEEAKALKDPRVNFIGHLDKNTLGDAYASAFCVVVPNVSMPNGQFEGFGLVAAEAAAAGGIVLASAVGGLPEAVIDGETGFILPADDADAWVAMILDIRNWSPEHREEFVNVASKTAVKKFNWQRVASETYAAYGFGGTDALITSAVSENYDRNGE